LTEEEFEPAPSSPGPLIATDRVLARLVGDHPGPTLICVGGLHGNEPAGLHALHRIIPDLRDRSASLQGEFIALAGNLAALELGRRFIDRDLNRAWTPDRVMELAQPSHDGSVEDREQKELLEELHATFARARGPIFLVDLHTTSGEGVGFTTVADTLRNRAFGLAFPIPLILGLEEQVDGTLMDYVEGLGHIAIGVETGQHDEPAAVDRAVAALWIAVVTSGVLPETAVPEVGAATEFLRREARGLPRVLEMRHRHAIAPEDRFRMHPGYRNFQEIAQGQILGEDGEGSVRSPESARILMPLYQEQGQDGFFLVREFRYVWLKVSEWLRKANLGRIVHWFPGIERSTDRPGILYVNRRVARWYALELLHLLGYRKHREAGTRLLVVQRPEPASQDKR
jgi:succinylglutamate desuccinylase